MTLLRGKTSTSGIFVDLLHYRAEGGDNILENHLNSIDKAKYTSHRIQNELIEICGDIIRSILGKMLLLTFSEILIILKAYFSRDYRDFDWFKKGPVISAAKLFTMNFELISSPGGFHLPPCTKNY